MFSRGNTCKAAILHVLESREHANKSFSVCSVFAAYSDFLALAMRKMFQFLVLHVGALFHLFDSVDGVIVMDYPDGTTRVWKYCFSDGALDLRSSGSL